MSTSFRQDLEANAAALAAALANTDLRIVTAESCTGGLLAACLASNADEVAYCDAVNMAVTQSLARGALLRSGAHIAVAVTGFCGPQKGDEEVGLVHIVCTHIAGRTHSESFHFGDIGRDPVLEQATAAALKQLADMLGSGPIKSAVEV